MVYAAVEDFLQQGDIFRQEVVTPVADIEKRIFRAADGRHGSVVFSEGAVPKIFSEEELKQCLQLNLRSALHIEPFSGYDQGLQELVVVHATAASYFATVSQTCDVCGCDKPAHPVATILPIITTLETCRRQRLPFESNTDGEMTIEEYLTANVAAEDSKALKAEGDAFKYPSLLRDVLSRWTPPSKQKVEERNKIRNFLKNMAKKGWVFFLAEDIVFGIPEGYVDLSVSATVPTSKLLALKNSRIACFSEVYRNAFAQAFGLRHFRPAIPTPQLPKDY
jgi:hypothetical protein